jgi:glycine/D-amino acid oxidase-like deaminating enzyme
MGERYDVLVVGGGFYGLYLAEHLARPGRAVLLCEREPGFMRRASFRNQARVHAGYHYPRSVLTAARSRANFPRFVAEFGPAVETGFDQVYAVARTGSKVSARQFRGVMDRIGAPCEPAPAEVRRLFDPGLIEDVFLTREYAFDADRLRDLMVGRCRAAGVELRVGTDVRAMTADAGGVRAELGGTTVRAGEAFLCTYAALNELPAGMGVPSVPLKHELTEMALVDVPDPLRRLGVTVMDGPFFSVMPFPARGRHSFSHVRYTPHAHWFDGGPAGAGGCDRRSAFPHMVRDAARFVPLLRECVYRESLWEVKTVLPRSEADDGRPILFRPHHGRPNVHLVMGGKIDNVYDAAAEIDRRLGTGTGRQRAA